MEPRKEHLIATHKQLEALYGPPSQRARLKQIDHLDAYCRAFIAAAPLLFLATSGSAGADCSPRGDFPGFAVVEDDRTLLLPDRRGNNRIDSLKNIIENPQVGLLFVVPGVHETLRVNGRAQLSNDPGLVERFSVRGTLPNLVVVISVQEAFMQCSRALVRADVWNAAKFVKRSDLPSMGTILAAHTGGLVNAAEYDTEAQVRVPHTLY